MARCAGFFFARRVRGRLFFVHCLRLLLAPRAMSSRSGCASSAALRPAFACDRAGAARRAEPRCSPPSEETLGRGQRLHPPVWPLGARTLRRHGSCRPRGGFHRHPPVRHLAARAVSPFWHSGPSDELPICGRGAFNPPVPRVADLSGARGHRTRQRRWGDGGAASCERRGAPGPRRAAGSQLEESRGAASGGEQAPSGRTPAGQEQKLTQ